MAVCLTCSHCGFVGLLSETHIGKVVRCRKCGGNIATARQLADMTAAPSTAIQPAAPPPPLPIPNKALRDTPAVSPPTPTLPAVPAEAKAVPTATTGRGWRLPVAIATSAVLLVCVVFGSVLLLTGPSATPSNSSQSHANPLTPPIPGNEQIGNSPAVPTESGENTDEAADSPAVHPTTPAISGDTRSAESTNPSSGAVPTRFPVGVPTFLITANTRQVFRVHLSGLHPSYAVTLTQALLPVIGRLPEDNPLRKVLGEIRSTAEFVEIYRSMRSKFLQAGVDTVYFVAEGDWVVQPELSGIIAIQGTVASRDRLAQRVEEAGHTDLAGFLRRFRPASQSGWLVQYQGPISHDLPSPAKAALVQQAFAQSLPIVPARVGVNRPRSDPSGRAVGFALDLQKSYPLTVANLVPNQLDRVVAPLVATLVPGMPRVVPLLNQAQSVTTTFSLMPFPYFHQVVRVKNPSEAQHLGKAIGQAIDQTLDRAVGGEDFLDLLVKGLVSSAFQVTIQDREVNLVMKPPMLFDLFSAQRTARDLFDHDWTALPAPSGHHWELTAVPGVRMRHDVLDRVTAIRCAGQRITGQLTENAPHARRRFDVSAEGMSLRVFLDRRGLLEIEGTAALPPCDLLDDQGNQIAVLRIARQGDFHYDRLQLIDWLRSCVDKRTEQEQAAIKELNAARDDEQREINAARTTGNPQQVVAVQQQFRLANQAKERAVLDVLQSIGLLRHLQKTIQEAMRTLPPVRIARNKEGEPLEVAPNRGGKLFAGQWLVDDRLLLTLYEDNSGMVAGTVSAVVLNQMRLGGGGFGPARTRADQLPSTTMGALSPTPTSVLGGKASKRTLAFWWAGLAGQGQGTLHLQEDGQLGTLEMSTQVAPAPKRPTGRLGKPPAPVKTTAGSERAAIRRIELGLPAQELGYLLTESENFAGEWVHPTQKHLNCVLKNLPQPAAYQAINAQGEQIGFAAGNRLFLIQAAARLPTRYPGGSRITQAVLGKQGQALRFQTGQSIGSGTVELNRRGE